MRIKNFTLMLMAVLFSTVSFAQKSFVLQKDVALNRQPAVTKLVKQSSILPALAVSQGNKPASVAKARAKAPEVVTPPEKGDVEYYTLSGNNSRESGVSRTVKVVWDDEDEDVVYISGLSYYLPEAFVKGTFTDERTVVFEKGQYFGAFNGTYEMYFGATTTGEDFIDAVATYDEDEGSFTFSYFLCDYSDAQGTSFFAYWQPGVTLVPFEGEVEKPVEIPNDLQIETYAYSAYDYYGNESHDLPVSGNLNIGIYGDDVYVQGMSTDFPNAWIKGTMENNTVTFPTGQLLSGQREVYFIGYGDSGITDYILIYNPEDGSFTEDNTNPMISSSKQSPSLRQYYYGYKIKPITEKAAVPDNSSITAIAYKPSGDVLEFNVAKVDVDGEGLATEKIAFILYYQDENGDPVAITLSKDDYEGLEEDLTEIPVSLFDGSLPLNMKDYTSWTAIGIQTVYYGGEERNESKITWYTPTWPVKVTLPEGLEVTEHIFKGETSYQGEITPFEKPVSLAIDGNDLYIRGLGDIDETAWVKGTKDADGNYVFPKGQDMGVFYYQRSPYYRSFLVGYAGNTASDVVLTVNAASGVYEIEDEFFENVIYTDKASPWTNFIAGATISIDEAEEEIPELVTVPEGLNTEAWSFSATDSDGNAVAHSVNVGFDGDDVYVQGVYAELPNAWVKGTKDGDAITFAAGQYLGQYYGYDIWFIGYSTSNYAVQDYVLSVDEDVIMMTNESTTECIGFNIYKKRISASLVDNYRGVTIKKVTEKAATPATPSVDHIKFSPYGNVAEFSVPVVDVNGDGLVTDKLSYKLYYEESDGDAKEVTFTTDLYTKLTEDMTVIPYGFLDGADDEGNPAAYDFYQSKVYLNMEHKSWVRIGIQSIYTGGGETNTSEIGWYTIIWPQVISLPEGAEVAEYDFKGTYSFTDGNQDFSKKVNVAFVDDSVFVQGVGRASSEAWVKGVKTAEDTYTFAKGQYMGVYASEEGDYSYLYLMGYNSTLGALDVKMKFDSETGALTSTTEIIENADYVDKLYYLTRILAGATITPEDPNDPDAISAVNAEVAEGSVRYNIAGQRVSEDYKGIVVKSGKKFFQK